MFRETRLTPSHPRPPLLSAGASSTETAQGTLCTPTKRPRDSGTDSFLNCPTLSPLAPTSPLYFFSFSIGLGERGDAGETTKDRREGGGQRGGPRDAKAEEPPALLSLPNQTRAGAAGTGLLPLWSVPVRHTSTALSHVLIKSGSSSTQQFLFLILLGAKFEIQSQIR